jgi:hypothetical protein
MLGIDTLRIVQDNLMDKDREIIDVHKIYSNTLTTIAADSASHTEGRFLKSRSAKFASRLYLCW